MRSPRYGETPRFQRKSGEARVLELTMPDGKGSELKSIGLESILKEVPAAKISGFLTPEECEEIALRLKALESSWSKDYGGEQYSFPNNYYARANDGGASSYFDGSSFGNEIMAAQFGGVLEKLLAVIRLLLPGFEVKSRTGWQGPGFVIFPANELLSRESGPVHIDLEGLVAPQVDFIRALCFSVIIMIQTPESGGGVRVWNRPLTASVTEEALLLAAKECPDESAVINYGVGDLVIINSLSPHQILKFDGNRARISLNAFAIAEQNQCLIWF